MTILHPGEAFFDVSVPVLIVGAGACGCTAALAAREHGAEVMLLDLFHTQGGLVVDRQARVLRPDGTPLPNLFAGGGAARGLSGPADWGYLSGNGLLAATNLGRFAGEAAARLARALP